MILGALAVSTAIATERENGSIHQSLIRECDRYGLDRERVFSAYAGESETSDTGRSWWDLVIVGCAVGVFVWLGLKARVPTLNMDFYWVAALTAIMMITAAVCAWGLWKQTRFS